MEQDHRILPRPIFSCFKDVEVQAAALDISGSDRVFGHTRKLTISGWTSLD